MFACAQCSNNFTPTDVAAGMYYSSTGICLSCYQLSAKNVALCFGKKEMYDQRTIACQQCPDNKICKVFIRHRKHMIKEKN